MTDRCAKLLRKFECFRSFPVCEIGREYSLLCEAACGQVVAACAGEGVSLTLADLHCTAGETGDLSTGFHCVDLEYSGACVCVDLEYSGLCVCSVRCLGTYAWTLWL